MMTSRSRALFTGLSLFCSLAFTATAFAGFNGFVKNGNGNDYPVESNGRKSASPPVANAHYLDGDVVKVDGKLDESVWERATGSTGFQMWDPERGELPSEETVFKVLYDGNAIYFGVACFEDDPSRISKNLSRRDRFSNSDLVSIYIDPYHDKTTGYNFKVNPLGVQIDSYVFNDGEQDQDWDAVWEAETYQDEHGWYAEIRVPFSSIRYRPSEDMTWGLQVYRYMHGRGEDTSWVTWDRETRGFVSRFGELKGLDGVKAPRQLEVTPYFVARAVDPSAPAADDNIENINNFGADVKYGITADLTLNATIQPDFGQVEADPAVVNLSPFETFFDEKRPFFIEGSRFFQHPHFNMFYSRRIGTGNEFSRIRFAGKLTGKMKGGVSVAGVFATTDVTQRGQSHNFFKVGEQKSYYGVARIGKEFKDANYKFNLMGTGVVNTADREHHGDFNSRNAYTGGLDFDLNFHNRDYNIQGSAVGAVVQHEANAAEGIAASDQYGTGGSLDIRRLGGNLRGGIYGRWESDRLDINDLGFLSAPDEINSGGWAGYNYNPNGSSKLFNRANVNFNIWKSWLYGARSGYDVNTGDLVWSYNRGHRQNSGTNFNGWMQYTNYYETYWGIELMPEASLRYETRNYVDEDTKQVFAGPLMTEPTTYGGWLGGSTDYRKKLSLGMDINHFRDVVDNHSTNFSLGPRWNQSAAINHEVRFGFRYREDDTQWLTNVRLADGSTAQGIGGVSYLFGEIRQRTFDLTWRSNILFSRKSSLEVYFQPYISVGNYVNARELATSDSYDLIPYADPDFHAEDFDFEFTSFNLNAVYRWEYRPGSTIYLVWTHSTQGYDERGNHENTSDFNNRPAMSGVFAHEPTNTFQFKISYWLPI